MLAANEAWFREINDRIEANALEHGSDSHLYEFICECSNIDCAEPYPPTDSTSRTSRRIRASAAA